jgi:hypothetical protein
VTVYEYLKRVIEKFKKNLDTADRSEWKLRRIVNV